MGINNWNKYKNIFFVIFGWFGSSLIFYYNVTQNKLITIKMQDTWSAEVKNNLIEVGYKWDLFHKASSKESTFSNFNQILNSIENILEDINSKGNNFIFNLDLSAFNSFVDSLSLSDLVAYFHISGCLYIIFCIISIVLTLFGNEALNLFKLESKFPSIAKLIKLRLSFARYYVLFNLIAILFACLFIIYVDYLGLTTPH